MKNYSTINAILNEIRHLTRVCFHTLTGINFVFIIGLVAERFEPALLLALYVSAILEFKHI